MPGTTANPYLDLEEKIDAGQVDPGGAPAPAPEAAENPYAQLEDALDAQRADRAKGIDTLFRAGLVAGDQKASVIRLARETGLKTDTVEEKLPEVERAWRASRFDPQKFVDENPQLADLLLKNPQAGQVALHDEQISGFTRVVRAIGRWTADHALEGVIGESAPPSVGLSSLEVSGIAEGVRERTGKETPEKAVKIEPLKQVPTLESPLQDAKGLDRVAIFADHWGNKRKQSELSAAAFRLMWAETYGLDTYDLEKRVVDLERETGVQRNYGAGPVEQILLDAEEGVASNVDALTGKGVGWGLSGAVGALATIASRSPAKGFQVASTFHKVVGSKIGNAAAFYKSFEQEAGQEFLELRRTKTDDGRGVDPEIARGAAVVYGLAAAGVEVAELNLVFEKTLGPLAESMNRGKGVEFMRAMVKDPSKAAMFRSVAKAWAKGVLGEGVEESVQQTLQSATTWGAASLSAGAPQSFDWADWWTQSVESFYKGAVGGAALGGASSSVNYVTRLVAAEQNRQAGAVVAAVSKLPASATAKASPKLVAELVVQETARSGQPVENLYVDAPAFVRLFQAQGADPDAAARELMGEEGPARLKEALAGANDGKLEVGLQEYLERWGDKGVAEALGADTATRPGGTTLREQQKIEQEDLAKREARVEALVQAWTDADKEGRAQAEPDPAAARLLGAVQRQLIATGKLDAKEARTSLATTQAFLETQAERFGLPVEVLFDAYATRVERHLDAAEAEAAPPAALQSAAPAEVDLTAPEGAPAATPDRAAYAARRAMVERLAAIPVELEALYEARLAHHAKEAERSPELYAGEDAPARAYREVYGRLASLGVKESVQAAQLRDEQRRLERWGTQEPTLRDQLAEAAVRAKDAERAGEAPAGGQADPANLTVLDVTTGEVTGPLADAFPSAREVAQANLTAESQALAERIADALEDPAGPAPDAEVVPPPGARRLNQAQNLPEWELKVQAWMEARGYSSVEIKRQLRGMRGQMKLFTALGPVELKRFPRGRGVNPAVNPNAKSREEQGLREGEQNYPGGPLRSNEDDIYILSFDLSAMCVKRLEASATMRYVQKLLNERAAAKGEKPRALENGERLALAALFREAGKQAPCLYCYVEAPRGKSGELVEKAMRIAFGKESIPSHWADDTRKYARAAIAEVAAKGLTAADVDPNYFTDADVNGSAEGKAQAERAPAVYNFARVMAASVTVNKPKPYEEYAGQILMLPDSFISKVNDYAGFRFFSSSDFQFEHMADLMQAVFDLSLRKACAHAYTKVKEFVEIFGATGMKIQTSVFATMPGRLEERDGKIVVLKGEYDTATDEVLQAFEQNPREKSLDGARARALEWLGNYVPEGGFAEDSWQGMAWGDAQALRKKFRNVGTVFVATTDAQVRWALDQPWVDYIIPFHHSGLEGRFFNELGWKSFQSIQTETWDPESPLGKGKKGKPEKIRQHELRAQDGVSDAELTKRYLALCEERGILPVFPQFRDHKNFAKLKKDYARTNSPFRPVKPVFDLTKAKGALDRYFAGDTTQSVPDKKLAHKLIAILDWADKLKAEGKEIDLGVESLRAAQNGQKIVQAIRRLHQAAYQGSPHRGIERMSTEFIGTGQGAASYGWGLYFAQNRQVAESYRQELARPEFRIRGNDPAAELSEAARSILGNVALSGMAPARALETARLRARNSQAEMEARLRAIDADIKAHAGREDMLQAFRSQREYVDGQRATYEAAYEDLRALKPEDLSVVQGQVYKVEVPDSDQLLDFDRPLSEQPVVFAKIQASSIGELLRNGELAHDGGASLTGEDLQRALKAYTMDHRYELGSPYAEDVPRMVSEQFMRAGIPGLQYLDQGSRGQAEKQTHNYVIWNDEAVKIVDRLYQGPGQKGASEKATRAWVDIIKQGLQKVFKITLTGKADLSSYLHETAHTFLEMMGDLSERPDAPQRVKDDYAKALAFLGAPDRASLTTEQEERWARAFEAYLMEGKAPSASLAGAFEQFRLWLLQIYRSITALHVQLDDNIRGVFDRLLATDAEIEQMKRAAGMDAPIFRSPDEAGMTPEQYEAYLADREKSFQQATLATQRKVMRDRAQAAEAWWQKQLEATRREAEKEWDARPDVRAEAYVRRGELALPDGRKISEPSMGKLDRAVVETILGPARAQELLRGRLAKEDGEHPDDVAQRFGFASGRELLEALQQIPDQGEWAKAEAERRMKAAHPDLLEEKTRLAEEAARALHNQGTSDWLLKEWVALRQQAGQGVGSTGGRTPLESLRLAAQVIVARMKLRGLNPFRVLQAERRHAEEAAIAAAKGDYKLAAVAKQQQLLNHFIYGMLLDARDARDALEELLSKLSDPARRGILGRGGQVYLQASDMILEALGAKEPERDPEVLANRLTVPEVMAQLDRDGIIPGFAGDRLGQLIAHPPQGAMTAKGGQGAPWMELTVEEMNVVASALRQLYIAARDANTVLLDGKRQQIETIANQIAAEAKVRKRPPPGSTTAAPKKYWSRQRLEGFNAALTDPEVILHELGPAAYHFFWDGYLECRNLEDQLAEKVLRQVSDLWDALPEEMQRRRYDLLAGVQQDLPLPVDLNRDGSLRDRQWMWMLALNLGNRSNMERLLGGYEWTEEQARDFLERNMTDEEWTFVEGVWKLLDEELWPQVAKVYEQQNGVRPEKIEALPYTLKSGRVIRGGYFPARYDAVASRVGQNQDADALSRMYDPKNAGALSVARSFTKARVKKYTDVVSLQWSLVPSHVANVTHYIAFDRFVRDSARVLTHGTTQTAVQLHHGDKYLGQLKAWLRTVATAQNDAIPAELEDVYYPALELRSRFVMSTLGWSLSVAAGDLSNPLVAIAAGEKHGGVGARFMTPVLLQALRPGAPGVRSGFRVIRDAAMAKSSELRHRSENLRMQLRRQLAEIGIAGKQNSWDRFKDRVRDSAWIFMEYTDALTATVIWEGGYRQALARGKPEAEAVKDADGRVRALLPTHEAAEQPAFLRDKRGMGALVAFYGYFSKLHNVRRQIWEDAYGDWADAGAAAHPGKSGLEVAKDRAKVVLGRETAVAVGRTLAMFAVANLLGELLSGRGPDPDESVPEWILRKMALAPVTTIPMLGTVLEQPVNAGVSKLFHGHAKWRSFSMRASPAAGAVERLGRILEKLWKQPNALEAVLAALEVYGLKAKLPVGSSQVDKTLRYLTSQLADDVAQGNVPHLVTGPIYGERRGQPANPVTVFTRD